jgi:hypothetical protein
MSNPALPSFITLHYSNAMLIPTFSPVALPLLLLPLLLLLV